LLSGAFQSRAASRSGEAKVFAVLGECLTGEFFVGGQHRLKGVQSILGRLATGATLAHRTRHFEHAGDDPAVFVRRFVGDGEVEKLSQVQGSGR